MGGRSTSPTRPYSIPTTARHGPSRDELGGTKPLKTQVSVDFGTLRGPASQTYDIFEGTEQIQQLVISRAISGLRIE